MILSGLQKSTQNFQEVNTWGYYGVEAHLDQTCECRTPRFVRKFVTPCTFYDNEKFKKLFTWYSEKSQHPFDLKPLSRDCFLYVCGPALPNTYRFPLQMQIMTQEKTINLPSEVARCIHKYYFRGVYENTAVFLSPFHKVIFDFASETYSVEKTSQSIISFLFPEMSYDPVHQGPFWYFCEGRTLYRYNLFQKNSDVEEIFVGDHSHRVMHFHSVITNTFAVRYYVLQKKSGRKVSLNIVDIHSKAIISLNGKSQHSKHDPHKEGIDIAYGLVFRGKPEKNCIQIYDLDTEKEYTSLTLPDSITLAKYYPIQVLEDTMYFVGLQNDRDVRASKIQVFAYKLF